MKKILVLILVATLFMVGCQSKPATNQGPVVVDDQETSMDVNKAAGTDLSELTLTDYNGNTIDGDTIKSKKLTVLNLWGTWCGPCVDEMPDFEKVHQAYKDKDVLFLGLALDSPDEEVSALVEKLNITYPLIKESDKTKELISNHFDYVPVTLFVDSEGKIMASFIAGSTTEADLTSKIEALINE